LPDWAVVDITKPGNNYNYLPLFVESQGFFDESWGLGHTTRADGASTRSSRRYEDHKE
jgi:hypothetical protein